MIIPASANNNLPCGGRYKQVSFQAAVRPATSATAETGAVSSRSVAEIVSMMDTRHQGFLTITVSAVPTLNLRHNPLLSGHQVRIAHSLQILWNI